MNIIIHKSTLGRILTVFLMTINYMAEGALIYALYYLANSWYVSGQETILWMVGALFLMFIRFAVSYDEAHNGFKTTKLYSFHIFTVYRTLLTLGYMISELIKKIPLSFEIKQ